MLGCVGKNKGERCDQNEIVKRWNVLYLSLSRYQISNLDENDVAAGCTLWFGNRMTVSVVIPSIDSLQINVGSGEKPSWRFKTIIDPSGYIFVDNRNWIRYSPTPPSENI